MGNLKTKWLEEKQEFLLIIFRMTGRKTAAKRHKMLIRIFSEEESLS